MNYLEEWSTNILARRAIPLRKSVLAQGVRDRHTGPSWQFAMVELRAEPSDTFSVAFDIPDGQIEELRRNGYIDEIVFGAIDVLATSEPSPVLGIKLHVVSVGLDPVRSSAIAFRVASRKAAGELLNASKVP